jgi:hypothetical protein
VPELVHHDQKADGHDERQEGVEQLDHSGPITADAP